MSRVVRTTLAADDDIADSVSYIGLDSPVSARRFIEEIAICFQRIAEFPAIGFELHGFKNPVRRVRVSPRFGHWLVIYRELDADMIEVVRVLHGRRDIAALLRETP